MSAEIPVGRIVDVLRGADLAELFPVPELEEVGMTVDQAEFLLDTLYVWHVNHADPRWRYLSLLCTDPFSDEADKCRMNLQRVEVPAGTFGEALNTSGRKTYCNGGCGKYEIFERAGTTFTCSRCIQRRAREDRRG